MADQHVVTLSIEGAGVSPETFSVADLAKLLTSLNGLLAPPENGSRRPSSSDVHLMSVSPGSARYACRVGEEESRMARAVGETLRSQDWGNLPPRNRKSLQEIRKQIKSKGQTLRIFDGEFSAELDPDAELFRESVIQGPTSLFGKVMRVGGKQAKAKLELADLTPLTVTLNRRLAAELGTRLYRNVVLEGQATWGMKSKVLRRFRAVALGPYRDEEADPVEAFRALRAIVGDAFDGVDPDAYVRELRGE